MNNAADPMVPYRNAISGLLSEKAFTVNIPSIEHIKPNEANKPNAPNKPNEPNT